MNTIPLQCICCPKKPKFSDVSHLLTHVASKGHLSNYYKMKVRSGSDEDARQVIDEFDRWYSDWDVEHLMHDRLSLKDKKRARPRPLVPSRAPSKIPSAASRVNSRASVPPTADQIDSRLLPQPIKLEARPTPPTSAVGSPHLYNLPPYVGGGTQGLGWHPHPGFQMFSSQHKQVTEWIGETQSDGSSLTSVPLTESTDSYTATDDTVFEEVDETIVADSSRLKGVFWPGMDIFDSATPEAKRKRNQRKDVSVIEKLEQDSTIVQATENVWSPQGGNLKKTLPITGLPEEDDEFMSSPLKPSPRKYPRRQRQRAALAELDGEQQGTLQTRTRSAYGQLAARDEKLEAQLSYGAGRKKRRIQIHEDEEDAPHHSSPAILHHPAPMDLLTQAFPAAHHFPQPHPTFGYSVSTQISAHPVLSKQDTSHHLHPMNNEQDYSSIPAFTLRQYSMPDAVPHAYYDANHVWHHADPTALFAHPSQTMFDHEALNLSPIKEDEQDGLDDDERTISAPPSEG